MSENTEQLSTSSDVANRLAASGIGVPTDLSAMRPYRLSTFQEMALARMLTVRAWGLQPGDFAENPWGFPFIPYPTERGNSTERLLLAPTNASFAVIGHPIYWIDPSLTTPTREESLDPARWNVRMFFLIMALGLFEPETRAWIGAPNAVGIAYTDADYRNYLAGEHSALDTVRFDKDDLLVPYEQVVEQANIAIAQMGDVQEQEWKRFRAEQRVAYQDAISLLDDAQSPWADIDAEIAEISAQIGQSIKEHSGTFANYIDPIFAAKARAVTLFNDMERTVVILSTPVHRDQSFDQGVYARAVALVRAYNDEIVDGGYDRRLDEVINEMVEEGGHAHALEFARLHEMTTQMHMDAWRRLKVAAVNFMRRERGEQPIADYLELQMMESLDTDLPEFDQIVPAADTRASRRQRGQ